MAFSQTAHGLSSVIDAELRAIVNSRQVPLYHMMGYHMGWRDAQGAETSTGKERYHGVLCLLSCQAVGGPIEAAVPAAAAVELVHNFTEIHDDVQSGSPQRYGRDTVWWIWGPAQAINAGDGMHALARLALFQLRQRGVSPDVTFKAVQALDEASLRTCEGRFLDLEAQERIDLSVEAYLKMAASKTGSLMACAMKLGGLVGGAGDVAQAALAQCGLNLGIAMQIRSDLRDLWGGDGDSPPGPDVLNKKKLLPIVYALEKASAKDKRRLGEVYFKRVLDPNDVAALRRTLDEMGVRRECEGMAEKHRAEAVAALSATGIADQGRASIESYIESLLR